MANQSRTSSLSVVDDELVQYDGLVQYALYSRRRIFFPQEEWGHSDEIPIFLTCCLLTKMFFLKKCFSKMAPFLLGNKNTLAGARRPHTHVHTHRTWPLLDCLLYCDMWPNYRISLVGYHCSIEFPCGVPYCSIEFPCGVPLFYCCKYPTVPHNLWRTRSQ